MKNDIFTSQAFSDFTNALFQRMKEKGKNEIEKLTNMSTLSLVDSEVTPLFINLSETMHSLIESVNTRNQQHERQMLMWENGPLHR